jgi:uncharacterized protein (TIGR02147 family)
MKYKHPITWVIMTIFEYTNYRKFLSDHISKLPKKGRGEVSRIAHQIKVNPTQVSMVLSGQRDLNQEQAFDIAIYLQLTEIESEYFMTLTQLERAGNHRLKAHIKKKLDKIKNEATKISNRFEHDRKLTEEERTIFYSSWIFSAIRLFCSTNPDGKSVSEISERFDLPRPKVIEILIFLKSTGLIIDENEKFKMGISRTFLEHGSYHLPRHHMNWRVKAMQKFDRVSEKELMFTFPLSVSRDDFEKIRSELAETLKRISTIVKDSPAEDIGCLNIDLFWVEK